LNKLILTADGSHTIFNPELNEHYHSVYGAVQESDFIFINNGLSYCTANPLNIFEVGFGTGLNALLTAVNNTSGEREINYTSIEKYPVDSDIIDSLNHHDFAGKEGRKIFQAIHAAPWNMPVNIFRNFKLHKIKGDITAEQPSGRFDLIFFDAFSPEKQPEMWTEKILSGIASVTKSGGILVTYTVKGEVKRRLRDCGFNVTLVAGPPGKRQIIRAIKN